MEHQEKEGQRPHPAICFSGYDVTYKIGDQQGKIRMDHQPGAQIPLDSNGQLILNNKA